MQANNAVTKVWGEKLVASPGLKLKNHVDLVELLDIADTKRGTDTFLSPLNPSLVLMILL